MTFDISLASASQLHASRFVGPTPLDIRDSTDDEYRAWQETESELLPAWEDRSATSDPIETGVDD